MGEIAVRRAWGGAGATVALAAALSMLQAAPAAAQPGRAMPAPPRAAPVTGTDTFREALAKAYEFNPTIQAQRAVLRQFDERVNQALAGWRPTVTASTSVGPNRTYNSEASAANRTQTRYPFASALTVTETVFDGFRTPASRDAAENDVLAQRGQLFAVEDSVLSSSAAAYRDVLRDLAVVDLNENNVRVLQRQLEATQDRFRVGEVTRTDVAQAEARLAQARADLLAAQGALATSRSNYERLIGEPPPPRLAESPPIPGLPGSRAEAVELATRENPNVVFAWYQEAAARDRIRVATSALYPTVSLQAQASDGYDTVSLKSQVTQGQILLNLSVPLYAAGADMSRIRESKQLAGQRRAELDQARRQATDQAIQSWENMQTAAARITSISSQIQADQIALEGVRQEALVGTRTVLDVLNAEQELLGAQVNLTQTERDRAVASYNLAAAVGRMTAENLQLPVQFYDYRAYYNEVRDKWWGTGD